MNDVLNYEELKNSFIDESFKSFDDLLKENSDLISKYCNERNKFNNKKPVILYQVFTALYIFFIVLAGILFLISRDDFMIGLSLICLMFFAVFLALSFYYEIKQSRILEYYKNLCLFEEELYNKLDYQFYYRSARSAFLNAGFTFDEGYNEDLVNLFLDRFSNSAFLQNVLNQDLSRVSLKNVVTGTYDNIPFCFLNLDLVEEGVRKEEEILRQGEVDSLASGLTTPERGTTISYLSGYYTTNYYQKDNAGFLLFFGDLNFSKEDYLANFITTIYEDGDLKICYLEKCNFYKNLKETTNSISGLEIYNHKGNPDRFLDKVYLTNLFKNNFHFFYNLLSSFLSSNYSLVNYEDKLLSLTTLKSLLSYKLNSLSRMEVLRCFAITDYDDVYFYLEDFVEEDACIKVNCKVKVYKKYLNKELINLEYVNKKGKTKKSPKVKTKLKRLKTDTKQFVLSLTFEDAENSLFKFADYNVLKTEIVN